MNDKKNSQAMVLIILIQNIQEKQLNKGNLLTFKNKTGYLPRNCKKKTNQGLKPKCLLKITWERLCIPQSRFTSNQVAIHKFKLEKTKSNKNNNQATNLIIPIVNTQERQLNREN